METVLRLTGMRFHAYHGCLDFERREGGEYIVNFEAHTPLLEAMESDRLEDTLNYAAIYDIAKAQMEIPSNLIEHVAGRIARSIRESFPALEHFSVTVVKLAPPVGGPTDEASFTVNV